MMKSVVCAALGLVFAVSTLSDVLAAPPPGLAKYQAARAEFDRMVADAEAGKGEMPRLSDPKAAEILRTLSDVDAVLGTQVYDWGDYATLSGMPDAHPHSLLFLLRSETVPSQRSQAG